MIVLALILFLTLAVKPHLRIAPGAGVNQLQTGNPGHLNLRRFLQHHYGIWQQPATLHEAVQRLFAKPALIGRIGKDKIKRTLRRARPKGRGIAPPDFAETNDAKTVGIAPDEPSGLGVLVNKLAELRTARQGFQPKRTSAGKKIDDAGTFKLKAGNAVGENVEDRFPHPVGGGARCARGGTGKTVTPKFSADNPHHDALAVPPVSLSSGTMKQKLPEPMRLALAEAQAAAARGEVPVGAVLVAADGEVLAVAGNRTIELKDPTAHAELLVIREAARKLGSERLTGCDLHVTLEPCAMCAAAISFARIRRVYFGAGDAKMGAVEHGPRFFTQATCHHAPEVYGGIGETEARALLLRFFKDRR